MSKTGTCDANTSLHVYDDVRSELKQRIMQRDSFSVQFIVASLAIITASFSKGYVNVIWLLPIISFYYTIQIFTSYKVHNRICTYLCDEIEPHFKESDFDSWETYCAKVRNLTFDKKLGGRKIFFTVAVLVSPFISFVFCITRKQNSLGVNLILVVVSLFISCIILYRDFTYLEYSGDNKLAFRDFMTKEKLTDEPNKAVFFDRDGTLHYDKVMTHKLKDLELFSGSVDLVKRFHDKGYRVIIVTNQSAIGKGYYSIKRMHLFNWYLRKKLKFVDAIYFCPHTGDMNCNCKKPKVGMFQRAQKDFNVNFSESIMIGDRMGDIKAGLNAGIKRNILVTTGIYEDGDVTKEPGFSTLPHETVSSLEEIEI